MSENTGESGSSTAGRPWLNRTVIGARLTGALGDCDSETTSVMLPGFLAVRGAVNGAAKFIPGALVGLTSAAASPPHTRDVATE